MTKIGSEELHGYKEDDYKAALKKTGYPDKFDKSALNWPVTIGILFILVVFFFPKGVLGTIRASLSRRPTGAGLPKG